MLILAVGMTVTEIAVRGRPKRAAAARRAGYLDGINAAARAVSTDVGRSGTGPLGTGEGVVQRAAYTVWVIWVQFCGAAEVVVSYRGPSSGLARLAG